MHGNTYEKEGEIESHLKSPICDRGFGDQLIRE